MHAEQLRKLMFLYMGTGIGALLRAMNGLQIFWHGQRTTGVNRTRLCTPPRGRMVTCSMGGRPGVSVSATWQGISRVH